MKLGFLLIRFNYIANYLPVMSAALSRGDEVTLFCLHSISDGKPGSSICEERLPILEFGSYKIEWFDWSNFVEKVQGKIQAMIVVEGLCIPYPEMVRGLKQIKAEGITCVSISHYFESILFPIENYDCYDRVCYQSEYGVYMHTQTEPKFLGKKDATLAHKVAITGTTLFDQFEGLCQRRSEMRAKYGIPPGKKVVLFMSLKLGVSENWRRFVFAERSSLKGALSLLARGNLKMIPDCWHAISYYQLLKGIRDFAKRSNACLVVKSRAKNRDPGYVRELADVFVQDESYYPYTSAELMSIADLCIHFQSGAVMEAVLAKVPSLAIIISQEHIRQYNPASHHLWFGEGASEGSIYQFDGVSKALPLKEAYELLVRSRLSDFGVNLNQRERYIGKYLGFADCKSSQRVLDVVVAALKS